MTDYEKAREAIRKVLCHMCDNYLATENCRLDDDLIEKECEFGDAVFDILNLPMIGVIESDQNIGFIIPKSNPYYGNEDFKQGAITGRMDLQIKGWHKIL